MQNIALTAIVLYKDENLLIIYIKRKYYKYLRDHLTLLKIVLRELFLILFFHKETNSMIKHKNNYL